MSFLFYNQLISKDWKSTYYLNPGIGIGWNFNSKLIFSAKLSFGRMVNEEYYYNLTIGGKYFTNKAENSWETQYLYIEPQFGLFFNRYPLSGGSGFGLAFYPKERLFSAKGSLFGGRGLFLSLDYIFKNQMTDMDLKLVIPYPFNDNYRKTN